MCLFFVSCGPTNYRGISFYILHGLLCSGGGNKLYWFDLAIVVAFEYEINLFCFICDGVKVCYWQSMCHNWELLVCRFIIVGFFLFFFVYSVYLPVPLIIGATLTIVK